MEAADRRVGAVRMEGVRRAVDELKCRKKSIKLYVKYSRTLYVHGNFAKRLQSTTMTMVFRFFKYAAKRKRRIFSVTTINNELQKTAWNNAYMYIKVRNKSDVVHSVALLWRMKWSEGCSSYGLKAMRDFGSSQVKQVLKKVGNGKIKPGTGCWCKQGLMGFNSNKKIWLLCCNF